MASLLVTFVFSTRIALVLGHAYMSWPPSRNFDKCDVFDPQSLNEHCDNCNQDACGRLRTIDFATIVHPVSDTYVAGGTMDIEVILTAHHKGFMELRLCTNPSDITQDCFNEHLLIRDSETQVNDPAPVDDSHPERWYLPPPDFNWPKSSTSQSGANTCGRSKTGTRYLWQVRIPSDVECDHCVLQLFWVTANSCNPVGVSEYFEKSSTETWIQAKFGGTAQPWFASGLDACSDAASDPKTNGNGAEKFWNCGDIRISKCSGDQCHGSTSTTVSSITARGSTTAAASLDTTTTTTTTASLGITVTTTVASSKCVALTNQATDEWCTSNCNHVPALCPPQFCHCGGSMSTTVSSTTARGSTTTAASLDTTTTTDTAPLDTTTTTTTASLNIIVSTTLANSKCVALTNQATDEWCTANCNHVPALCPPQFCHCGSSRRLRGL